MQNAIGNHDRRQGYTRMNALVTYRITDARKSVMTAESAKQALYREAQLALRAVVGTRDLDSFLTGMQS